MKPNDLPMWTRSPHKSLCLIGMSGVGKTYLANLLRQTGRCYHYGVDYRIGSHYLRREIDDDLRKEAMNLPRFRNLLRSDAVTVRAKFSLNNLDAMAGYLGKIGDSKRGGLNREEFLRRQEAHLVAERAATLDAYVLVRHARDVLEYSDFVCDTSGSLCSVVDPWSDKDDIMCALARNHLIVYIEDDKASRTTLVERYKARPKPIFYSRAFFESAEQEYLAGGSWDDVDPDRFAVWAFERIVDFRLPRYREIARRWGYTLHATDLRDLKNADEFWELLTAIHHTPEQARSGYEALGMRSVVHDPQLH